MARKVLNKVAGSSCMKNVASSVMTRWSVSNTNDNWWNTGGRGWTVPRDNNDSYILTKGSWAAKTAGSYHSGMGLKLNNPDGSQADRRFGYKYYWGNASASDCGGCSGIFSALQAHVPSDIGTQTGNFEERIGWASRDGTSNQPLHVWCGNVGDDSRQRSPSYGHMTTFEVPAESMNYVDNSSS